MFCFDMIVTLAQQVFGNVQLFLQVVMLLYLVVKMPQFLLEIGENISDPDEIIQVSF